jgi:gamma-glutamyltranspeptidase / glutathione hydrolase
MRSRSWAALTLVVLACKRDAPPPPPSVDPATITWPPIGVDAGAIRPQFRTEPPIDPVDPTLVAKSKTFMVVSEAEDATKVGRAILASGGNAVDAAVATAFALAVVQPTAGNIGGGGFAVVRISTGKAAAIDFRETAPAAASENMFLDKDGKAIDKLSTRGHLAAGVPGSVAGLHALHAKYGVKPWKDVVEPAIKLARDGFALGGYTSRRIADEVEKLERFPASAALWLENGRAKAPGTVIKLPELATTLERIRDRGPDGFYKGETAKLVADEMKQGGGIITLADLAAYKPVWREPLKFSYRGHTLFAMPPPSSGGIVLAMTAGMLRDVDVGKLPWHGPDHVHRLAEVWRRAFSIRNNVLGDPAFVKDMPIAKLTSAAYLDKLAATIKLEATKSKDVPALIEGVHTTHLCVVDGKGMAVALTTTINDTLGSGLTIPGAGFMMNDEMDDFTTKPGSPNMFGLVQGPANKIEPGKRMLSSMSPTIVEDGKGDVLMLAGAGGGPKIITAVWQTISNVIDYGNHADLAVAQPRVHQVDLPDLLRIEGGSIDEPTNDALRNLGHTLDHSQKGSWFAHVTAIVKATQGWEGAADPRVGGAAMGD